MPNLDSHFYFQNWNACMKYCCNIPSLFKPHDIMGWCYFQRENKENLRLIRWSPQVLFDLAPGTLAYSVGYLEV